jgi:hypothetical protein
MTRTALALLLTCAVAALGIGCGDDDDNGNGGGGGESLTKAEYIKRGDALCRQGDREIEREGESRFGDAEQEPSRADLVEFVEDAVVPNIEDQISELRDLPVPEGDEETVNAIYDEADQAIESIKDNPEAAIEQEASPFEQANRLARDYGFKECGED